MCSTKDFYCQQMTFVYSAIDFYIQQIPLHSARNAHIQQFEICVQ